MTDIPTKTKQIGIFALANAADPEKDHARLLKCLENLVSYQ